MCTQQSLGPEEKTLCQSLTFWVSKVIPECPKSWLAGLHRGCTGLWIHLLAKGKCCQESSPITTKSPGLTPSKGRPLSPCMASQVAAQLLPHCQ